MPISARPSSWAERDGKTCLAAAPICPGCAKVILGRAMVCDGYAIYTCDNPTGDVRKRCGVHSIAFPFAMADGDPPRVSICYLEPSEFRQLLNGSTMKPSQIHQFIGNLLGRDMGRKSA